MEIRGTRHQRILLVLLAGILLLGLAGSALAAAPVTAAVAVNGDPAPGATVTAKATVTITDGSTLISVKWTQVGGLSANLSNTGTDTVTITLPNRKAFRTQLMTALEEQPITDAQFPANVPRNPYEGGLQNRWGVAAVSPHAMADAAAVKLDLAVTTTSGTYHIASTVAGNVPWDTATGTRNVPLLLPVLLHGKKQATYDWSLSAPPGSTATLLDPTSQDPEFTPDIANGKSLTTYNPTVPAGTGLQDLEPFKNRANAPELDWGFATVTVLKGTNVLSSASLIDMKTNDPTTIPAKQ